MRDGFRIIFDFFKLCADKMYYFSSYVLTKCIIFQAMCWQNVLFFKQYADKMYYFSSYVLTKSIIFQAMCWQNVLFFKLRYTSLVTLKTTKEIECKDNFIIQRTVSVIISDPSCKDNRQHPMRNGTNLQMYRFESGIKLCSHTL